MNTDTETNTFESAKIAMLATLLSGSGSGSGASAGTTTALRRFDPIDRPGDAAIEVCGLLGRAGIDAPPGTPAYDSWSLVLHCLALTRGNHQRAVDVGTALVNANVSEARIRQLLESDRPMLFDLLPRIARRLAASSQPMDWGPLTRLALSADINETEAQRARLEIAYRFQRAMARAA